MKDMFPSKYLSKDDAPTPIRATIRQVTQEEIKSDHGNETKNVVLFAGDVKPMILNRGNADMLSQSFGDDSDLWLGKTIEVYVDPNVMFGGKRVGGLRLRLPTTGAGNGSSNGHGTGWSWQQAQTEAAKAGISKEMLVDALKKAGAPGWNPIRDTPLVQRLIAEAAVPFDEFEAAGAVTGGEENGEIPF